MNRYNTCVVRFVLKLVKFIEQSLKIIAIFAYLSVTNGNIF